MQSCQFRRRSHPRHPAVQLPAPGLLSSLCVAMHAVRHAMFLRSLTVCEALGRAGIATSLKVLFSADDCSGHPANAQLALERNEVIALLNLLERLSNSIEARSSPRTYSSSVPGTRLARPAGPMRPCRCDEIRPFCARDVLTMEGLACRVAASEEEQALMPGCASVQVVRVMSAELMHANGSSGAIQQVTHERLGQAL